MSLLEAVDASKAFVILDLHNASYIHVTQHSSPTLMDIAGEIPAGHSVLGVALRSDLGKLPIRTYKGPGVYGIQPTKPLVSITPEKLIELNSCSSAIETDGVIEPNTMLTLINGGHVVETKREGAYFGHIVVAKPGDTAEAESIIAWRNYGEELGVFL